MNRRLVAFVIVFCISPSISAVAIYQLKSDNMRLQRLMDELEMNYTSLEIEHAVLENQYGKLHTEYESLQTALQKIQTEYATLESTYNNLAGEHSSYVSAYQDLRYEINNRIYGGYGSPYITPGDTHVIEVVQVITGGWNNRSDWNEFWNETKTMYSWVRNNIEYRSDGLFPSLPNEPSGSVEYSQSMWQFSNETLNLKQGDCEDQAILLCSMIVCYSKEPWAEVVGISNFSISHAAVQVPVAGDKIVILDPAGNYYSRDPLGNIVADDISSEINRWLDHCKSSMGEDVYVSEVFSAHIKAKYFTSTTEYLSWMYMRN